jgi:hypothetical protein
MATLQARQGATFRFTWESRASDALDAPVVPFTAGLQARFQAARERGTPAELIFDTATLGSPLTIDHAAGLISFRLGATQTALFPAEIFQFDLDLYDPNDVTEVEPFDFGAFVVTAEVK